MSTGNQQQEEWLVLPEDLLHMEYIEVWEVFFSRKNFVAIEMAMAIDYRLLILNLVTRKRFWISTKSLEQKILAQITDVDLDGDPYDLEELAGGEKEIRQMRVKSNRIEMKYHITQDYDTYDDMAQVFIGQS